MKIALIGTRGVPAQYGGFETAVEEIGQRLAKAGHEVTVFCRGATERTEYLGMQLVHRPALRRKTLETLSHTALSLVHPASRGSDVAIVFNAANAPLLPILRMARVPTAVHVDGLEWQRSKWGRLGRTYYLHCEALAVKWADALISDAIGIQSYYRDKYNAESVFIPYGAPILTTPPLHLLEQLSLTAGRYHLLVARFEPENHVLQAVQGYVESGAECPLVVVGGAPYNDDYTRRVEAAAAMTSDVRLTGPIWDQQLLNALYAGACTYVHGHSVGGTNPSLLRAMGAGAPVLAFDVNFNREVLAGTGQYWSHSVALAELLVQAETDTESTRARGEAGRDRAAAAYTWDRVSEDYAHLLASLTATAR